MQVFKTFFKIVKKQLPSASIYLGVFLILCVMMGNSQSENKSGYTAQKCNLVIVDRDGSEASAKLVEYLSGIHEVEQGVEYSDEQIQDYLFYNKIDYVLYIEEGYETTGQLTNKKRPGTVVGIYVDNQISMYEKNMKALTNAGYSYDDAYKLTIKALDSDGLVEFATGATNEKPLIYWVFSYVPYVVIMIMFFIITPVIVAFNKKELNDRMNISPMTLKSKNMQIISGAVIVGLFVWILFIGLACAIGGYNDFKDMLASVLLNTLVFVIVAAAMATIAGNLGASGSTRDVAANIIGLGMSFLGGIFVPIELFDKSMLAVARFMPTYWYVKSNNAIFDGAAFGDIAGNLATLFLFAVAFFMIAVVISKKRRAAGRN